MHIINSLANHWQSPFVRDPGQDGSPGTFNAMDENKFINHRIFNAMKKLYSILLCALVIAACTDNPVNDPVGGVIPVRSA